MSATGERGATLIEALVVLTIMALVGTLAFPAMERGYRHFALRTAVERLQADLRRGRAQALAEGRPVTLTLAADGSGYALGPQRYHLAVDGLRFAGGPSITFFGDGSSSGGAIAVLGPGASGRTTVVQPATALVVPGGS